MSNLKYRLVVIGVLIAASIWALFPRDVSVRLRRPDGSFFDTVRIKPGTPPAPPIKQQRASRHAKTEATR